MTGLRIDGGDHAVGCDTSQDPKHPVRALFDVLTDHGREQRRGLRYVRRQRLSVECEQDRVGIARELIHQLFTRLLVVPRAGRLAGLVVRVVAFQQLAQLLSVLFVDPPQHTHDRASNQRDGILGRHGVVEGGRVDDAFLTNEIRLLRDVEDRLEDAIRSRRVAQSRPHIHEQRRVEARRVVRKSSRPLVSEGRSAINRPPRYRSGPRSAAAPMTVAITRGAMLRRPRDEYRSANISSGKNRCPCSASNRNTLRSPTPASHSSRTDR